MDAKKTIDKLRGESGKARYSVYFTKALMEDFKGACGDISVSRVLEELMKEFVESAKKSKSKTAKAKKTPNKKN